MAAKSNKVKAARKPKRSAWIMGVSVKGGRVAKKLLRVGKDGRTK